MKLADLLAERSTEGLVDLARECARVDEPMARPQLLVTIDGVLRSHRFLQEFLVNRQPPTFVIVMALLEAEGFELAVGELLARVESELMRICSEIQDGELLKRDDQLRVYRRVLYQARSNDLMIDAAELAILGVLRQELAVTPVEHFLLEHHSDLQEHWRSDGAFQRELSALAASGIVFLKDGSAIIPEDLAPAIRQVLGIEMSREAARRLFMRLDGQELYSALQTFRIASSGSKDAKVAKLLTHMVAPSAVLSSVGLDTLREVCRGVGIAISGSKGELVERIVGHVAAGRDVAGTAELPPPPPPDEPRALPEARFRLLFESLRGLEVAGMLAEFDLRRGGTKRVQADTLWNCGRSEVTLLSCLSNLELDVVLTRLHLKTGGSKAERVDRIVQHFASMDEDAVRDRPRPDPAIVPVHRLNEVGRPEPMPGQSVGP